MGKRIALTDYIEVDGVDLSYFARSVAFTSADDQVDVSGFNATGTDESLAGKRARSVTVEFGMGRGSNEPHQVLYPLHKNRSEFDFVWRSDVNNAVGATNPELRGTVILPQYDEGAVRGDYETASLTFVSQGDDGLEFYET